MVFDIIFWRKETEVLNTLGDFLFKLLLSN